MDFEEKLAEAFLSRKDTSLISWRCPQCKRENRGTDRKCANCSKPQPKFT